MSNPLTGAADSKSLNRLQQTPSGTSYEVRNAALFGRLASDLPRRQMRLDIVGIERRSRKGPDAIGRRAPQGRIGRIECRVVEVRPATRLGGFEHLGREWRLAPAHHLRIKPRRLRRIGPRGTVAADEQI